MCFETGVQDHRKTLPLAKTVTRRGEASFLFVFQTGYICRISRFMSYVDHGDSLPSRLASARRSTSISAASLAAFILTSVRHVVHHPIQILHIADEFRGCGCGTDVCGDA